jgi:hypothetical protein
VLIYYITRLDHVLVTARKKVEFLLQPTCDWCHLGIKLVRFAAVTASLGPSVEKALNESIHALATLL